MRLWIDRIALLLLIAAFCVPALGYAMNRFQGQTVSESERRLLTPIPQWSGDIRLWTSQIEVHFEDGFGLRFMLIRAARKIKDNLGEDPPLVAYGQDGWMFVNDKAMRDEFRGDGAWDRRDVERWVSSLSAMKAELDRRDMPFVALIAPDKVRLYADQVPNDWRVHPRRFKSALEHAANKEETGLINVEPVLQREKDKGHRVFYKRDTHWSPDGYVPVSNMIMDQLDPDGLRARTRRTQRIDWEPKHLMDLDGLLGNPPGLEPAYFALLPRHGEGYGVERLDIGDPKAPTVIAREGDKSDQDTLVIVGDSFADAMLSELTASYGRVVRLYHGRDQYRVGLDEIMAYEPAAVLFLAVERNAIRMDAPFAEINQP